VADVVAVRATKHLRIELAYPGKLTTTSKGDSVRRVQEWLTFHDIGTRIDGDFGPATATALTLSPAPTARPALLNVRRVEANTDASYRHHPLEMNLLSADHRYLEFRPLGILLP